MSDEIVELKYGKASHFKSQPPPFFPGKLLFGGRVEEDHEGFKRMTLILLFLPV